MAIIKSEKVFSANPWLEVFKDSIKLPSGRIINDYYRVTVPSYVIICARLKDSSVVMERQFKHAINETVLALPSGMIDEGESPLDAAKRELAEETGYIAEFWEPAGSFYNDANRGFGKGFFFIAKGLKKVSIISAEDTSEIEVVVLNNDELDNAISNGEVQCLASVALILLAKKNPYSLPYEKKEEKH